MKILLSLLTSIIAVQLGATTYYTCATNGQITTNPDGTTGCSASTAWNASGNELIVRAGTTFSATANNQILTIVNGATLTVVGTLDFGIQNNCEIIVASGGTLNVNPTGLLSNVGANANSLITVNSGGIAAFKGSVTCSGAITINSNNVTIADNAAFNQALLGSATAITLQRNFNRAGWHQINFPVTAASSKTLANLVASGGLTLTYAALPTATVYVWTTTATTSSWQLPTSSLPLVNQPLELYVASVPAAISLNVTPAQINASDLAAAPFIRSIPAPSTTPPGNGIGWTTTVTDGWVKLANPFQSFLSSDLLGLSGSLDNAVYVWNGGSSYVTRAGGVGAAQFISPNQSFFVHCTAAGSYQVPLVARNVNPTTKPNYFKTGNQLILNLNGAGHDINTYIAENPSATSGFDGAFDAHYLYPNTNFPTFNSVGIDSTAYSVNQVPDLAGQEIYLSFFYENDNENFTISLDQGMASNVNVVVLEDLFTQTLTDLKNYDYSFISNKNAPAQRFKIHFSQSTIGVTETENGNDLHVWIKNNQLQFEESADLEGATINVYSATGQLISSGTNANPIFVNQTGVYVVHVLTKKGRVYISKVAKL